MARESLTHVESLFSYSIEEVVEEMVTSGRSESDLRFFADRFDDLAGACRKKADQMSYEEARNQEFEGDEG